MQRIEIQENRKNQTNVNIEIDCCERLIRHLEAQGRSIIQPKTTHYKTQNNSMADFIKLKLSPSQKPRNALQSHYSKMISDISIQELLKVPTLNNTPRIYCSTSSIAPIQTEREEISLFDSQTLRAMRNSIKKLDLELKKLTDTSRVTSQKKAKKNKTQDSELSQSQLSPRNDEYAVRRKFTEYHPKFQTGGYFSDIDKLIPTNF